MHKDHRGYFYRSKRVGDRVMRQYVGRGAQCNRAARLEALQREEEAEERRIEREERGRLKALDGEVKTFCAQVTMVMRLVLQSHGYHQHARGQWRKQRMTKQRMTKRIETDEDTQGKAQLDEVEPTESDFSRLQQLFQKADTDPVVRRKIFQAMDEHGITVIAEMHNCSRQVEVSLLDAWYGENNPFLRECQERNLAHKRREMAGDNATPLEQMLAERVVTCWFNVQLCEITLAQRQHEMTLTVAAYQQKRLDHAHKRHLSAIKALAEVRRLQAPTMQVNIGEKQINIAQGAPQANGELA